MHWVRFKIRGVAMELSFNNGRDLVIVVDGTAGRRWVTPSVEVFQVAELTLTNGNSGSDAGPATQHS